MNYIKEHMWYKQQNYIGTGSAALVDAVSKGLCLYLPVVWQYGLEVHIKGVLRAVMHAECITGEHNASSCRCKDQQDSQLEVTQGKCA
jgi:hypothetical protein